MQHLKNKILHITPHLGGGVGSVLLNWLVFDKSNIHSVATLDYANDKATKVCKDNNIALYSEMNNNIAQLLELIEHADIVLIHFWNHPLLYDFLVKNKLPSSRVIFWSHVSGLHAPYVIPKKILDYADKFIFTTYVSHNAKEVAEYEDKNKFSTILSTGGVENFINIQPKEHKGFNVGYVGTVDYSKMHPDFIATSKKINIPEVKFIIVGGDNEKEISKNANDKFEFVGKISDIKPYLEQFDVFGYPLHPEHFGTAEQVLQEAMASGIVPVVLNNPTEKTLVKHMENGLVANNLDEYVKYVELLYNDKILRQKLSQNARKYAKEIFSLENLTNQWNKVFDEVLNFPKTIKKWDIKNNNPSYFEVFLESLGEYKHLFMVQSEKDLQRIKELAKFPNWQSQTKGTAHQYHDFFKNDEKLKKISKLMKEN